MSWMRPIPFGSFPAKEHVSGSAWARPFVKALVRNSLLHFFCFLVIGLLPSILFSITQSSGIIDQMLYGGHSSRARKCFRKLMERIHKKWNMFLNSWNLHYNSMLSESIYITNLLWFLRVLQFLLYLKIIFFSTEHFSIPHSGEFIIVETTSSSNHMSKSWSILSPILEVFWLSLKLSSFTIQDSER